MHVISLDFDSISLKNKKHWNTFTTDFFIPVDDVIEQLSAKGHVTVDKEKSHALEKGPMACRFCGDVKIDNIPKLKVHLQSSLHKSNIS